MWNFTPKTNPVTVLVLEKRVAIGRPFLHVGPIHNRLNALVWVYEDTNETIVVDPRVNELLSFAV